MIVPVDVLAAVFLVSVSVIVIALFMQPRRFYFVRHGETLLNAQHIRQGEEGGLSVAGQEQARSVGEALKTLPIGRIISSTYPRARETAEILRGYLRAPVLYSPLFAERRNPSEIIGKPTRDPEVMRIVDEMDLAYHGDDYRFSDEESFLDLRKRARKCVSLLARQGARETVIVTHHHFLKMLLAYMLYRERLHASDFVKLSFFNISDNAGISVAEFHPWKMFSKTRGWTVVSFNQTP
jgi:probable phosphoglycerate mutase